VVRAWVAKIGESVLYLRLEYRNRLGVALPVQLDELLG
jgi:hypothetical protein